MRIDKKITAAIVGIDVLCARQTSKDGGSVREAQPPAILEARGISSLLLVHLCCTEDRQHCQFSSDLAADPGVLRAVSPQ